MNNSHVDPNISLGLNILDGVRASHADLGHKPFGVDGGSRTVQDMLRCSFMMAGALRDHGITGIYYQFPMLYYAYQQEKGTLPTYWDGIRVLHLLPKYANQYTNHGEWPIPKVFIKDRPRKKLVDAYSEPIKRGFGKPLSFVPSIDSYWLGDSLRVFEVLGKQIHDLMVGAESGEEQFDFPKSSLHFDRWLASTLSTNPIKAGLLYLINFFPQVVSEISFGRSTGSVDRLTKLLGDEQGMVSENSFALLKFGTLSLRLWIHEIYSTQS